MNKIRNLALEEQSGRKILATAKVTEKETNFTEFNERSSDGLILTAISVLSQNPWQNHGFFSLAIYLSKFVLKI